MSQNLDVSLDDCGGDLQKLYTANLQANSAVDEYRTRPQTNYSFRHDSCSIGGNKAKAVPETEVDPSNVPAQLWETVLDLHPDRWRCFSAAKSGNPHFRESPFKHIKPQRMQSWYRWGPIGNKGNHRLPLCCHLAEDTLSNRPQSPQGPQRTQSRVILPQVMTLMNSSTFLTRGRRLLAYLHFYLQPKERLCIICRLMTLKTSSLVWEELQFAALIFSTSGWLGTEISFRWAAALSRAESCSSNCCSMLWSANDQHVWRIFKLLLWRARSTLDFTIGNIQQNRDRERYIPAADWFFFLLRSY